MASHFFCFFWQSSRPMTCPAQLLLLKSVSRLQFSHPHIPVTIPLWTQILLPTQIQSLWQKTNTTVISSSSYYYGCLRYLGLSQAFLHRSSFSMSFSWPPWDSHFFQTVTLTRTCCLTTQQLLLVPGELGWINLKKRAYSGTHSTYYCHCIAP